ncbi:efflux transporter outer membrane subunit [Vibrio sp. ABG19]|uniref:efflux transporter outer membrane subunit n=1 Tax=Vibrio sp. ABG19 TaxID=2817385 RepID=UPI00249F3051|nr:efflux transporter outer membrane subunit [Vibrio sp. ABG19]WGY47056.1 efflux transporter outer membrane subunit [Vibrio sp. ABG19]
MRSYQISTLALCVMLATGCVTRSELEPQDVQVPDNWQSSQSESSSAAIEQWWKSFNDPQLNTLIDQVLATNNDLALATLTLREARLQAGLAVSDTYPDLSANASAQRSKPLDGGDSSASYQASLGVSYELDLWGKLAAAKDAAMWTAMASQEEREATAQSLVATTAQLYWQIGYLSQRIALSNADIDEARQTLALTESQYRYGSVSRINVLEAQRSLAGIEATHRDYLQQYTEAKNAFALLFNQPPQESKPGISTLPDTALPEIEAGIPADVLSRRPDVKQALFELKSALADKDNTDNSYFPSLTLTGALGGSSTQLRHLLSDPIGSLGADLALPFLNWNEMQLNRDIADVRYQSAIINYRQTLYSAFQDVDNALSARDNYRYQAEKLQQQYDSAREAAGIYKSQYQYGAIDITTLLDAQENERSAKASLLENRYNRLVNLATIYQSLGGEDVLQ